MYTMHTPTQNLMGFVTAKWWDSTGSENTLSSWNTRKRTQTTLEDLVSSSVSLPLSLRSAQRSQSSCGWNSLSTRERPELTHYCSCLWLVGMRTCLLKLTSHSNDLYHVYSPFSFVHLPLFFLLLSLSLALSLSLSLSLSLILTVSTGLAIIACYAIILPQVSLPLY